MEGAMLYRKFPAYNLNVSSAIPSDNLVRSMRSFTIPITTNFGLFSQMLKVTLETFLMRRGNSHLYGGGSCVHDSSATRPNPQGANTESSELEFH